MVSAEGKVPTQQINSEGVASIYDCQQFAFVGGVVALSSIECLTLKERRVLLFPFTLE